MAETLDPRRHAFRPDLAAETLRGRVAAPKFAAGDVRQVIHSAAPLRNDPDARGSWTTEALFGERARVYDEREGWAWVQLERDGYVGYVHAAALSRELRPATHRVKALGTFLFPTPDIKAAPWTLLSMNAMLAVSELGAAFARLDGGGFVPARHLADGTRFAPDFVSLAEAFMGVPYLWGGKTRLGVDCSGLLQTALHAGGLACPRDSDMQQAELGTDVPVRDDLEGLARGDLVFWRGHVGIMVDAYLLLHANAYHMAVVVEPLGNAVERIAGAGGPITAIKRLARKGA